MMANRLDGNGPSSDGNAAVATSTGDKRSWSRELTAPTNIPRLFRTRWSAVALAAIVFLSIAPTLSWLEFHHSIENLNVATALEMKRGGPWLVPNLQGRPRLAKPPITAWITAAAIRPSTMAGLDLPDPAARAAAYGRLGFDTRWPALLACCLVVLATYELGRAAAAGSGADSARERRVGLTAAVACATTFFFFRQSQYATTDAQLALWVAVSNAAMAVAVFRRRYWVALPVAGVALGMSLLAKGPVGLLESLIPVVVFVILRAIWSQRNASSVLGTNGDGLAKDAEHGQRSTVAHATQIENFGSQAAAAHHHSPLDQPPTSWKLPLLVGVLLMLAVGSSWYVAVAATHENVLDLWRSEISRVDADEVPAGAFYSHFVSLWQFFPWLAWLALGIGMGVRDAIARRASPALFAALLLLVPVIVLSFAKDRFPRYLVPLMPVGSLLIALGLEVVWNGLAQASRHVRMLISAHWLMAGGWAIGLPLIMAGQWIGSLRTPAGDALLGWIPAIALAALAAAVLALGTRWQRRQGAAALVAVTFVLMLGAQMIHAVARANSPAGDADLRPAAEQLRRDHPNVKVYARGATKKNPINIHANTLSIYLNQMTHWTDTAQELDSTPGPLVMVMSRGRSDPDPPTPPGWQVLLKTTGGDKKYVFFRP